jgi:hypothetical protein
MKKIRFYLGHEGKFEDYVVGEEYSHGYYIIDISPLNKNEVYIDLIKDDILYLGAVHVVGLPYSLINIKSEEK